MVARRLTLTMVCVLILGGGPAKAAILDPDGAPACSRELAVGGDVQAFADSLSAGDVGCLHGGTYTFSALRVNRPGITLKSYPGERAKLVGGFVYVPPGSTNVTLARLDIDTAGFNGIGVQVFADGARLLDSDVTNEHLGQSCVTLSDYDAGYPTVHGVEIRGNRIHGCGKVADGNHDHGVYVANAYGPVVTGNEIEDVHGGWGIQLWTTSLNGVFERNVIRASPTATQGGVVIVGGKSLGNTFRDNTLVSTGKPYVVDAYASRNGATFASNCIVANGAPMFADSSVDGGGNRSVAAESDCSAPSLNSAPDPTPDPPPRPSVKITEPTGDIDRNWVCPTADASDGTTSVRFTLDGSSYTATQSPWESTCWSLQAGEHTLKVEASTGATDSITFTASRWVEITEPTGDISSDWTCPRADASDGTDSVRFTLDGTHSYTAQQAPWQSTCWGDLAIGEHTLIAETPLGATDRITFWRR
jgi:hypothetical protein